MYLAIQEIRRNTTRFLLISSILALITTLILFIVALAEGLGSGNIQGIQKLNADLLVFQERSRLSLSGSAMPLERVRQIRRVEGVQAAGPVGFSGVAIPAEQNNAGRDLDVAFLGVEPGSPGEPAVVVGRTLRSLRERAAIIDRNTQERTGLQPGDLLTIRSVQDAKEERYELTVVGVTDDRQFSLRPSIFVPLRTWDRMRPGTLVNFEDRDPIASFVAVQMAPGEDRQALAARLSDVVPDVEVADLQTAYQATPGYREQQSTLGIQQGFTWFIGLLVVGVFFQIITLQKVAQVGVLKAIGASNWLVLRSALSQMALVTFGGVAAGALGAALLALGVPGTVPLSWPLERLGITLLTLLIMGPLGGIASLRVLLRVEPLTALGLAK